MTSSLVGATVLVTGGSRGIGKGIARCFALAGAHVVITARDGAVAEAASESLTAEAQEAGSSGSVTYVTGDVAREEDAQRFVDVAIERHGGLDVVCANAGIFPDASFRDLDLSGVRKLYDEVLGTNVLGTMLVARAALDALIASGRGRIVLTSSITGPITGLPGWTHYGASKAAQLGWMRTAAVELAPLGVTVNAVLPGNIATEGLAALGEEYERSMVATIPTGRLGTVEDIGHAAVFLASAEAGFITGQTLVVDGGQVLPESLA